MILIVTQLTSNSAHRSSQAPSSLTCMNTSIKTDHPRTERGDEVHVINIRSLIKISEYISPFIQILQCSSTKKRYAWSTKSSDNTPLKSSTTSSTSKSPNNTYSPSSETSSHFWPKHQTPYFQLQLSSVFSWSQSKATVRLRTIFICSGSIKMN